MKSLVSVLRHENVRLRAIQMAESRIFLHTIMHVNAALRRYTYSSTIACDGGNNVKCQNIMYGV